jgi:hypothetical protein
MPNKIKVFVQDYKAIEAEGKFPLQEDWTLQRKLVAEYTSELFKEAAAEEAFKIFNAPEEVLDEREKDILKNYRGPSLSVGDIVEVHSPGVSATAYLCASTGWKTRAIEPEYVEATKTLDKNTPPTLTLLGKKCYVEVGIYRNNNSVALKLTSEDGDPMCSATVNLDIPDLKRPSHHVFIKNYGENSLGGPNNPTIAEALENAGVGTCLAAYTIGDFHSEVVELEITHPWVLNQVKEQLNIIIKEEKSKKAPSINKVQSSQGMNL